MIWLRILDSPLLTWAIVLATVLLVGPLMLFIGIHIGEGRAPEVSKRRLSDVQRKVVILSSALSQSDMALADARDVKRAMIGAARDMETTLHKHVNRLVEAAEASARSVLECAAQRTAEQRAKERTA